MHYTAQAPLHKIHLTHLAPAVWGVSPPLFFNGGGRGHLFQNGFEIFQILFNGRDVVEKFFAGLAGLAEQGENKFASLPTGDDPHGIMNRDARFQLDVVVQDAELVFLGEFNSRFAEGRVHDPRVAVPSNGRAGESRRPLRKIPRIGRKRINVGRRAFDGDADVSDGLHRFYLLPAEQDAEGKDWDRPETDRSAFTTFSKEDRSHAIGA